MIITTGKHKVRDGSHEVVRRTRIRRLTATYVGINQQGSLYWHRSGTAWTAHESAGYFYRVYNKDILPNKPVKE